MHGKGHVEAPQIGCLHDFIEDALVIVVRVSYNGFSCFSAIEGLPGILSSFNLLVMTPYPLGPCSSLF